MTEQELSIKTRLACQTALLGVITSNIRMITVGWDNLSIFQLRVYFNNEPSEDEIEEMDSVSSEILASIPFESDKVECVIDNRPRKELEVLKWIVYAIKE